MLLPYIKGAVVFAEEVLADLTPILELLAIA